jgi:glycosyltransferase involved in cell wall biosynthesis
MTITVVVCAYNEAVLLPGCLYSLLSQTRPPDEILVINNASTDATAAVARAVPGVRVLDEPVKGLVVARETGRRAAQGDIVAYIDADCRVPIFWLERVEAHIHRAAGTVGLTGPYRFYDWDWAGRTLIRIFYGGNFAVRADALAKVGGFDRSIEFHGEDTNLGRRLTATGTVDLSSRCWIWTSARRYRAVGKRKVIALYVRNFWSEIVHHRPADREHLDVRA